MHFLFISETEHPEILAIKKKKKITLCFNILIIERIIASLQNVPSAPPPFTAGKLLTSFRSSWHSKAAYNCLIPPYKIVSKSENSKYSAENISISPLTQTLTIN